MSILGVLISFREQIFDIPHEALDLSSRIEALRAKFQPQIDEVQSGEGQVTNGEFGSLILETRKGSGLYLGQPLWLLQKEELLGLDNEQSLDMYIMILSRLYPVWDDFQRRRQNDLEELSFEAAARTFGETLDDEETFSMPPLYAEAITMKQLFTSEMNFTNYVEEASLERLMNVFTQNAWSLGDVAVAISVAHGHVVKDKTPPGTSHIVLSDIMDPTVVDERSLGDIIHFVQELHGSKCLIPRACGWNDETDSVELFLDDVAVEDLFEERFAELDKALLNDTSAYVHCAAGASRSATVVALYLISRFGMSSDEAISFLKKRRDCVDPQEPLQRLLRWYEHELARGGAAAGGGGEG